MNPELRLCKIAYHKRRLAILRGRWERYRKMVADNTVAYEELENCELAILDEEYDLEAAKAEEAERI